MTTTLSQFPNINDNVTQQISNLEIQLAIMSNSFIGNSLKYNSSFFLPAPDELQSQLASIVSAQNQTFSLANDAFNTITYKVIVWKNNNYILQTLKNRVSSATAVLTTAEGLRSKAELNLAQINNNRTMSEISNLNISYLALQMLLYNASDMMSQAANAVNQSASIASDLGQLSQSVSLNTYGGLLTLQSINNLALQSQTNSQRAVNTASFFCVSFFKFKH